MAGALQGIRVLELCTHLSGPYCAMLLGDLGADVIKIEAPGGDVGRELPPFIAGESAPFMLWNRNKRSIGLNLKEKNDQDTFRSLVDSADILVENFRPGTMDRLGFGYETLRIQNPRLIYTAISGFGNTGPYRARAGFDLLIQGMSGLMSVCGPKDGPPYRLPIAISDVASGLYAAVGTLAALEARHRTGKGQLVDASLLDSAVSLGLYEAAHYFATGGRPPRRGQAHPGNAPYQVMETADGAITIGGAQQNFWEKICEILDVRELLEDERFSTNALRVKHNDELVPLLEASLKKKPSAHWLALFDDATIPCGPVLAHDEVLTHPQVLARKLVEEVKHPTAGLTKTLGVGVKLSDTPSSIRRPAPLYGEHTKEIRREAQKGGNSDT